VSDGALGRAAQATLACLAVAAGQRLVVVHTPGLSDVATAIRRAGEALGCAVDTVAMQDLARHGAEPPAAVADALIRADAAVLATSTSLSHTRARRTATARGARVASMPQLTTDMLMRTVPVDYVALRRRGAGLASALTKASQARLTAPSGTDITFDLGDRVGLNDDGDLSALGAFGNLPAGEAYIAPIETGANGVVVFDASLASHGVLEFPIACHVVDGHLVRADGPGADAFLATLDSGGPNGRSIAELAIGTNDQARVTGLVLEDEKVLGTAHVAFGASNGIGGRVDAEVHIDGVLHAPTLVLDGVTVVRSGVILI